MNSVAPDGNGKRSGSPALGVAPALVVAGLALILTVVMLYPSMGTRIDESPVIRAAGRISSIEDKQREVQALPIPLAEVSPEPGSTRTEALAREDEPPTDVIIPCRVVDPTGWGVAQAEVWANDGNYRLRGLTADDGTFELKLDPLRVNARLSADLPVPVGARHSSHGPTLLAHWRRPLGGELELCLRGVGAALRIAVVDPGGQPIGEAEVILGESVISGQPTGLEVLSGAGELRHVVPPPPIATDTWGQALLTGLEPGEQALSVSALGFCPRYGRIQLSEGQITERRIHLQPACAVEGFLARDDSGPLAGARVLGVGEDPLSDVQALCSTRGEYLLEALPAGRVQLFGEYRENGLVTHAASTELELEPHRLATWDGVLSRLEEIHGRLVNSSGVPLIGWRVELRITGDRLQPSRYAMTARDGRFHLPSAPRGQETELLVFHPDSAAGIPTRVLQNVHESGDECLLQLTEGEDLSTPIRGVVARAAAPGEIDLSFLLQRVGTERGHLVRPDEESGLFQTPAVPPGDYIAVFPRHGRGWAPDYRYRVYPGVPLDIGTIELETTGVLRLLPNRTAPNGETVGIKISLLRRRVGEAFRLEIYRGRADVPLDVPLAPGRYALEVPARMQGEELFTILSSETTRVTVPEER